MGEKTLSIINIHGGEDIFLQLCIHQDTEYE